MIHGIVKRLKREIDLRSLERQLLRHIHACRCDDERLRDEGVGAVEFSTLKVISSRTPEQKKLTKNVRRQKSPSQTATMILSLSVRMSSLGCLVTKHAETATLKIPSKQLEQE